MDQIPGGDGKEGPATPPAEPPQAPPDPEAPASPPPPTPEPPADAPDEGAPPPPPEPQEADEAPAREWADERAWRRRFQAKVAGVMMMVLGAFLVTLFAVGAYQVGSYPIEQARHEFAEQPGGVLELAVPGHGGANVTLACLCPSGHVAQANLDAEGDLRTQAPNTTFQLSIHDASGTLWQQPAFVPNGTVVPARLDDLSAGGSEEWLGPDPGHVWPSYAILSALCVVVAAGGWLAYRRRAPRFTMAAAILFLLVSLRIALGSGFDLLGLSFLATAGLVALFIYRGRTADGGRAKSGI